jgi:uncharacterized protein YqjF (DUF2071 family)
MPSPFLTARWSNLCIFSYAVPPSLLQARVPPGLELDTRDENAFVSVVAFDFLDTRVLGVAWPGYRNFPELNLRFYVRHGEERGVVFVREFVQSRVVTLLARLTYNEPYRAAPLQSVIDDGTDEIRVEHRLLWRGRTFTLSATGRKPAFVPAENSDEHFFKEQRWGFGISRRGRTIRYEVRHEGWKVYPIASSQHDLDWAYVYGPEWGVLQKQAPCSTVLAVGSSIQLFPNRSLQADP